MMVLISAGRPDHALYLGLELMSLALYVVASSNRDNAKSTEAGLKLFRARCAVVGNAAVRRPSLIYGFTGTVGFAGIAGGRQDPAALASCLVWCSCSPDFASRSRPYRSTCGRPDDLRGGTDARSPRSLLPRRRSQHLPCLPA